MGCATTSVKITSILFYIILATLAIGGITYVALNPEHLHEDAAITAYVGGGIVIAFAILGCLGAIRESVFITATCAIFLFLLVVVEIGLTCFDWRHNSNERSSTGIVDAAWDTPNMANLQTEHKCCGKVSANDYVLMNKPIPSSCYRIFGVNDTPTSTDLYFEGCISKVQQYLDSERLWFLICFILLVAFEVLGFLLALFLIVNFRNKQRRLQF